MLTLYQIDYKSFLNLLSGDGTAEKRTEKGATEEVFLPPVTPGSPILP